MHKQNSINEQAQMASQTEHMVSDSESFVIVGQLGAPYGIRGWLKVSSYTDDIEHIFNYQPWFIKHTPTSAWQPCRVTNWKRHNKGIVCTIEGFETREAVQQLTNLKIAVSHEAFPQLPEDEFYWQELTGMAVYNQQNYHLGKVKSLLETGSNDVLVVAANANDAFGQKERLIPLIDESVIKKIDRQAQRIDVDWDPGF